ncbi:PA14 domain-containing protein [Niallia circulans]|uniref:PA14 domain-containing protein n=1 Tax=Niallia circulans TaxID=1397 RepID=UPI0026EC9FE7|nr:PA14 domain-containing protein [Niallia circulans]
MFLCFLLLLMSPQTNIKAAENTWSSNFYNNKNLSETPISKSYNNIRFNWGKNEPIAGINKDNFSASFEKNITISESQKDYFLHTYADDGVRMYLDNQKKIDRWTSSSRNYSAAPMTNLSAGNHTVKTEYYEGGGNAVLFADMLPFGSWIGYFYNNEKFSGNPEDALVFTPDKNGNLSFDYQYGKPNAKGIGSNHFSAKFFTYKKLPAGNYILQTKHDDDTRIYIDGKLVLDSDRVSQDTRLIKIENSQGKDVHEIRIEYVEKTGKSYLQFSLKPVQEALSTSTWFASYFNNTNVSGNAFVSTGIKDIKYNWGKSAPNASTNKDNFSASFYKLLNKGDYFVYTFADDGVRAKINNSILFDRWTGSSGKANKALITNLNQNNNVFQLDYLEKTGKAFVNADVLPLGQWLGYYYSNTSLKGAPANKTILKGDGKGAFSFNYGKNAPMSGIPKDNFSASFTTALRLNQGEYVIRSVADDGIRVYVDDKLVINRWTSANSKEDAYKINISDRTNEADSSKRNIHWIRVEYLEKKGNAKLNFDIKPINQVVTNQEWMNIFYPNTSLSGNGTVIGGLNSKNKVSSIQYLWKKDAPLVGMPKDNFSASFLRKVSGSNDYFVSTFADDGIRVKLDNKTVIDRWKNSSGTFDKAIIKGAGKGEHIIQTDYMEKTGNAYAFADIQPLGNWVAYYYNNKNLSGAPVTSNVINNSNSNTLTKDYGKNAPISKINKDNFSAKYVTAKRLDAGEYVIRGLSDDGVRVYIDGKLVVDNWKNGSYREKATKVKIDNVNGDNVHWIEVRYYDNKSTAKFQVSIQPYNEQNMLDGTWYAEYYPEVINKNQSPSYKVTDSKRNVVIGGKDSLNKIYNIDFNWKKGSPDSAIPSNKFSAVYKKVLNVTENSNYNFKLKADNGAVLEVDGKVLIDAWNGNIGKTKEVIGYYLPKGKHTFVIKYYEGSGDAHLSFDMEKSKVVTKTYNDLKTSLNDAVNIQLSKNAQTDKKYKAYMREDAFEYVSSKNDYAFVKSGTWNVRGGTSKNSWVIGTFKGDYKVTILSKTAKKDSDGKYWYEVDFYKYSVPVGKVKPDITPKYTVKYNTWVNASPTDIKYYMNPSNFENDNKQKLQFLLLSSSANLNSKEVNDKILKNRGILAGKGSSFNKAGEKYGINEIYLISHALLETGNGTSSLATGIKVSSVDGKKVTPKTVYNMYGIGAVDGSAVKSGSEYAYKMGWDTAEKAIIGGAEFIGKNYINNATYKQDTLYKMRWNPSKPGVHQYATDIGWASKQVSSMYNLYNMLTSYRMDLEIPKYK